VLQPDDVIDGKYRIVKMIGKGGMGAVYEGENLRIHRKVANKVLHASLAEEQANVQRFEREAQAAGRIGSDHIVEVLDLGDLPTGDRYMVMEFLEGESLRTRIERLGRMRPDEIVPITCDLLDGLADAHRAGIIHRDLKPDNIFLVQEKKKQIDFVKIVDFGVSKFKSINDQATQTGVVFGTPHYMSPEQAKGEKNIDHRSDLYAVGVILYRALCGAYPFTADTFNELMFKVVLQDPKPLYEQLPEINDELALIVHKAMARELEARFQSAEELAGALREWLNAHGFAMSFQRSIVARPSHTGATPAVTTPPILPTGSGDLAKELSTRMTSSAAIAAVAPPNSRPKWPLYVAALTVCVAVAVLAVKLTHVDVGAQHERRMENVDHPGMHSGIAASPTPSASQPALAPTSAASESASASAPSSTSEPRPTTKTQVAPPKTATANTTIASPPPPTKQSARPFREDI
jgi:serine/threonine-protein kinase